MKDFFCENHENITAQITFIGVKCPLCSNPRYRNRT